MKLHLMLAKRLTIGKLIVASVMVLCGLFIAQVASEEPGQPAVEDQYAERHQIDPIEANGAIFVDWPKPDVVLVFTGEQDGYLEPCGCAGLENQKGGLRRRFTLLKELREKGWPVVAMDLGGQEKRTGVQPEIKTDFAYRALAKMEYAAVGFGPHDLRMDLLPIVINLDAAINPLVSANVGIVAFDSGFTQRYKIVEAGGMKIGITSVLGKKELAELQNAADLELLEPYQAVPQVLPKLREAKCDHLVLLAHAEPDEAKDLARRFHEFDWVVAAHGAEEPPNDAEKIDGAESHLVEVGHKGMYVSVVGLYNDGRPPFRFQRVPLDSRFNDAPEIQQMHVDYQHRLETLGLEGLGLKPSAHPSGGKFASSKACADCHIAATEVYENTPHFHATETLVKLDPPRHFDPECLSCHATGWEPQRYFPFQSGFVGLKETPHMVGNGCENCHGPAARHVAAENGDIEVGEEELEKLRAALRLRIGENEGNMPGQVYKERSVVEMCMHCHDVDNSPDFDFQKYWPNVKHEGKD
jgi:Cytochrome c554 and c-prime